MITTRLERLEDKPNGRCRKWKIVGQMPKRGGKYPTKAKRFEGTYTEAEAERARMAELWEAEAAVVRGEEFVSFGLSWNDSRLASGAIAQRTHDKNANLVRALGRHLGGMELCDVTPEDVQAAYAALKESGCRGTRGWSGTSLRTAHNCAQAMFDAAVQRGLAASNPFRDVTAPRTDTRRKEALSLSDADALLSRLSATDAREFAVSMMLRTGMRAGECLGVEFSDVRGSEIRIRREVTKTDAGERSVPMDDETRRFVEARKAHVCAVHGQAGAVFEGGRLCCTDDGRPLTYNALRRWWERHRAGYGLDGWTLHQMRHTYLTNLAQAGVHPSVMQRLAGHSSMAVTMEIYTHVHDEDMRKAVLEMSRARANSFQIPSSRP